MRPNLLAGLVGGQQWRGISQGMSPVPISFSGAWARTLRLRHYSNTRFDRFRLVFPVFWVAGTPIADTLFPNSATIQCGFETPYVNATTGIPTRITVTFNGGQSSVSYNPASPPASGYLVSDTIILPSFIEAGAFFGIWTTFVDDSHTGTNKCPAGRNQSNFLQKYIGYYSASADLVASNYALTSSSIATPVGTTQTGSGTGYGPAMMLIPASSSQKYVFALGDSIGNGDQEGYATSGSYGDASGSSLSNAGFISRGLYEGLGYDAVVIAKSSDRNGYLATPANWQYRRALMQLANPTHIINQNIHNDVGATTGWYSRQTSTAYNKWDVLDTGTNLYLVTTAGTTGSGSLSGTGSAIVDGTCIVAYIGTTYANSNKYWGCAVALAANVNAQIAAACPGVPIIGQLTMPKASSTDSWLTTANQTALWLASGAVQRNNVNQLALSGSTLFGTGGRFMDARPYVEYDYTNQTSKWVADGSTTSYVTNDGVHPNSVGNSLAAQALVPGLFA